MQGKIFKLHSLILKKKPDLLRLKDEKGLSLIELNISIMIAVVLSLAFFVLIHNFGDINQAVAARIQLQQEGSLILMDMVKDIREAETITIDSVEGGTDNCLEVYSPFIGVRTYWSVGDDPITGHKEGELYKNEGAADELLIGDYNDGGITLNVDDLTFTDDESANLVTIFLDLQLIKTYPDLNTKVLEVAPLNASAQPRNR